jgi:Lamin Tail Domain
MRALQLLQQLLAATLFVASSCIVKAQIVITEIMNNPEAVTDDVGEWFEVYNAGTVAVNLFNWTVAGSALSEFFVITTPFIVQPNTYAVLGANGDRATNGNVGVNFVYKATLGGFQLTNADPDRIILRNADGVEVDRVAYSGSQSNGPFPNTAGASMSLRNPALDNAIGANWCAAITLYNAMDKGTPGSPNTCPSPPPIAPLPPPVAPKAPVPAPTVPSAPRSIIAPKAPPTKAAPKTPTKKGAPTLAPTLSPSPTPVIASGSPDFAASPLPTSEATIDGPVEDDDGGGNGECIDECKTLSQRPGVRVHISLPLGICIPSCSGALLLPLVQLTGWKCGPCP